MTLQLIKPRERIFSGKEEQVRIRVFESGNNYYLAISMCKELLDKLQWEQKQSVFVYKDTEKKGRFVVESTKDYVPAAHRLQIEKAGIRSKLVIRLLDPGLINCENGWIEAVIINKKSAISFDLPLQEIPND